MINNINDLIEDDFQIVKFKKRNKDYQIKIRGISAYDIALMYKEESLRDIITFLFNDLDTKDSESIYNSLLVKAPELIAVIIAICDYDELATPELVKKMPVSAQIECFNYILNLTFGTEEQDKIEENLKKLIAETSALMKIFVKNAKNKE